MKIRITPMLVVIEKRPMFLTIRQKVSQAAGQKLLLVRAI
jgi:hypothetical protein